MAIAAPVAGARILTSDLAAFYNLLKGVSGSGESLTLIYNAAGSLIFQPSSDPAAATEAVQIKNNAGTVQSALSFDGRFYAADGLIATPGIVFENDKDTGLWRSASNVIDFSVGGVRGFVVNSAGTPVNYLTVTAVATGVGPRLSAVGSDTDVDVRLTPQGVGLINFDYAVTALGGGAAPTVGTIGGSGPAVAGQNSWLKMKIGGTASFLPVWR